MKAIRNYAESIAKGLGCDFSAQTTVQTTQEKKETMGKDVQPTEEQKNSMEYIEMQRYLPKRPISITKVYEQVLDHLPDEVVNPHNIKKELYESFINCIDWD